MPTVLAAMAHPDDAELLCGGTLARLAQIGWEIHIVTATAGDCGSSHQDGTTISARRLGEAQKAAKLLGGEHHCLGLLDGRVFLNEASISALTFLLRKVRPSIVITHARSDYMVDHEQMSQITRSATFTAGMPNYPLGNLGVTTVVPHLYHTDPIGLHDNDGLPVSAKTIIDISSTIDLKRQALLLHDSQMEWLRHHHGISDPTIEMVSWASQRGQQCGCQAGEGFNQHRGHAYPTDDLLVRLLA